MTLFEKIIGAIISSFIVLYGLLLFFFPDALFIPDMSWDGMKDGIETSQIKWEIAPTFVVLGFVFIFFSLKEIPDKKKLYKCVKCGKVFKLEKSYDFSCDICDNPVDKLEGFF